MDDGNNDRDVPVHAQRSDARGIKNLGTARLFGCPGRCGLSSGEEDGRWEMQMEAWIEGGQ